MATKRFAAHREDELRLKLPAPQAMRVRTEADFYGASSLVWEAMGHGMTQSPRPFADWVHGIDPPWDRTSLEYELVWRRWIGVPRFARRVLVATMRQAEVLAGLGYRMVQAVGAPILYAERWMSPKILGMRVLMPEHSLAYRPFGKGFRLEAAKLIDYVKDTEVDFNLSLFCLYGDDVESGQWPELLDAHGLRWVQGASINDRNALRRMVRLLSQAETIQTNALGSHIVYAAWLGCTVNWLNLGPRLQNDSGAAENDPFWSRHPDGPLSLERSVYSLDLPSTGSLVRQFGIGQTSYDPVKAQQVARESLGLNCRRSPEEMATLLGFKRLSLSRIAGVGHIPWRAISFARRCFL